jgi:hypothetical protein
VLFIINNFDTIDPNFKKDLLDSDYSTWIVARNLRLNGYTVTLPPIGIRPDTGRIKEFGDSGDLVINGNIIEVKQRPDLKFDKLSEFPYSTLIVDVKHHFDSLEVKPRYYVICNSTLSGAIIVSGKTSGKWTTSTRWDNKRGRMRTFYLVSRELCHFWDFGDRPRFEM